MAIKEPRKFKFFDLNHNVDNGSLALALKDTQLSVATSGNNSFIFGDSEGNIIFLNKEFAVEKFFKAYNLSITHATHIKQSTFLVTIGEDEAGVNPLLKVWNVDVTDKTGTPRCVRITRLIPDQKAVAVTAVAVHESSHFLAVGFMNGSILLFRGDIARNRNSKPKLLKENGSGPITGLAFKSTALSSFLFVCTLNSVISYDISLKDKEVKWQLDDKGCEMGCSAMSDLPHETQFVVARDSAIYCYNTDGKGPCYPLGGKKVMIQWLKTFLIVVAKEELPEVDPAGPGFSESSKPTENDVVTIFDFHNNLIVSSSIIKQVAAILVEYGLFFIVTKDHKIHQLVEKTVQSKLALLFKKNLYEVAIRMAKSQHYDEDGLVDIFRQYGDHLNSKGDHAGAIDQYIKTIGKLEPSYIIRKFMDSAHMEQLIAYLQALHRKELATADHTTLLFNCFIKLGKTTELKEFIMTQRETVKFDVDIALKVVRGVKPEDALILAKAHNQYLWVVRILLEDMQNYTEACCYLRDLEPTQAAKCVLDFGDILMEKCPEEITKFLKQFCKENRNDSQPSSDIQLFYLNNARPTSLRPQDFLHLFLNKSEYLVDFLENLVNESIGWDTKIYNALAEHYLVLWKKNTNGCASNVEGKLMALLQNPNSNYDKDHVFLLCQMHGFTPGRIFLYEENKMYNQVVQAHIEQKNYKAVLAACRRFSHEDPNIWIQALWSSTRHSETPQHILSEILSVIKRESLQPPLMTLDALDDSNTLGQAREYLKAVLAAEDKLVESEKALIEKHGNETLQIRQHIKEIESNPVIFQGSRCSVCSRQLELPSVHFLCQHSYHQHCFQGYAEFENECIVCVKNNKVFREKIKSQEKNHELHEAFHKQLAVANDGLEVVSNYFKQGVFNKVNIASPVNPPAAAVTPVRSTATPVEKPVPKIPEYNYRSAVSAVKEREKPKNIPEAFKPPDTISSSYVNPFDASDEEEAEREVARNPFADDSNEEPVGISANVGEYKNPFA